MHCRFSYALLFACATVGCYPEVTTSDTSGESVAAGAHRPWAPDLLAGGAATAGGPAAGAATAGAAGATAAGGVAGAPQTEPQGCVPGHFILLDELSNARDLGGTPLSPTGTVACGAVFRGPPLTLSESGCANAARLGIRTILDLRTESEQEGNPDASCAAAQHVSAPLPVPYGLGATDYLNDLHETASIALAFHTFGDPAAYPIYFHCTFGRDRTGIVGALLLLTLGATRAAVMQEYMLSQPHVGAFPDSLSAVLDEVEQRGGAEMVLKSLGITEQELAVMRATTVTIE